MSFLFNKKWCALLWSVTLHVNALLWIFSIFLKSVPAFFQFTIKSFCFCVCSCVFIKAADARPSDDRIRVCINLMCVSLSSRSIKLEFRAHHTISLLSSTYYATRWAVICYHFPFLQNGVISCDLTTPSRTFSCWSSNIHLPVVHPPINVSSFQRILLIQLLGCTDSSLVFWFNEMLCLMTPNRFWQWLVENSIHIITERTECHTMLLTHTLALFMLIHRIIHNIILLFRLSILDMTRLYISVSAWFRRITFLLRCLF